MTTSSRVRTRLLAAAIVVSTALALAACGDDSSDSGNASSGNTSSGNASSGNGGSGNGGSDSGEKLRAALGTGPSGGSSFGIGAAMSEVLRKQDPPIDVTAEEVAIAPSNLTRLGSGELQFGFNTTYDVHRAVNGLAEFDGAAVDGLQFVGGGSVGGFGIVVPADSDIETVADLCGKKFSAASPTAKDIIASMIDIQGTDPECIDWNMGISYDQSVQALQDKTMHASAFVAVPVSAALQQLVQTMDVRFIGLDTSEVDAHNEKYPFFPAQTVEAGELKGLDEDWIVPGFIQGIWTHEQVDENLVYQFTKGVLSNAEACDAIFAGCGVYTAERSAEWLNEGLIQVPVSPGAERAITEAGGSID